MPEHARRFSAAFYDQSEDREIADWGGDDLFTRMPRARAGDDRPGPRFARPRDEARGSRASETRGSRASDAPRFARPRDAAGSDRRLTLVAAADEPGGAAPSAPVRPGAAAAPPAAPRLVAPAQAIPPGWAPVEPPAETRATKVITGRPEDRAWPQPLPLPP